MTQSMLSKSNLWCQELFQGRHLSEIAELFFSYCRRRVKAKKSLTGEKIYFSKKLIRKLIRKLISFI